MAEGKALGKDDLFEKDAFQNATKGAQELLAIIKETQDTIKGSLTAQKEFVSTFKAKSYDDVKRLNTAIAETNTLIKLKTQLDKDSFNVSMQNEKLAAAKVKTQREEIKNQQVIEKQNKATEKSLNALNGEYAKGVKQLAEIKKQLKELEYTGRTNGKVFKALSQDFETLNKSVRGAEEKVGEFQRNVGNYASGFSPLSNSINQLTREMPAFANSVQTGFMAISNNLPIFFDAISGIKKANEELRAQGQPTKSILSQLGAAFFSWGTALSVGVTLLTVYGKEMVNFIIELVKGKDALTILNEALATTYEKSTKIIRENTEALLELQVARGKIIKQDKEIFLIEGQLQIDRKLRNAEYLKQQRQLAKDLLGLELDKYGSLPKQKAGEYRNLEDVKKYYAVANKLREVANKDIENMEKTAAYKIETARLEGQKEAKKKVEPAIINDEERLQKILREIRLGYVADEKELAILRLKLKYDEDVKQINALKASEAHKAQVLKELEAKLQRDLQEIRSSWNNVHIEEDAKLLDKRMKQNEDATAAFFAKQEKDAKKQSDIDKKRKDELIKQADQIEKAIEKRYAIKNKIVNDNLDRETESNKNAIETQQRLAEKGLDNTLAFEKQKAATLELEKKRQQEKEIRQQKIFAFYNLFSSYAKTDPNTALQKAIVDTALAEVISGSFIEGTENVERDLKGNKVHNGTDGYVVAVDGRERILNPDQNAKIGGISNDELANIAERYNKGLLFNYGNIAAQHPTIINQNIALDETNTLLRQLLKETKNKPVHQPKIDMLGQVIDTEIRNGFSKVVTNKRRI
jgi:hypothetical protein